MVDAKGRFEKGQTPWNKGKKGLQVPWNKGLKGYGLGHKLSEESRRKVSEGRKGKHVGFTSLNKGKKYEEIYSTDRVNQIKSKIKIARIKQIFPTKDSKIELRIQELLSLLHLEYFTHKYISEITHAYQCDIFIPVQKGINQKTIIECDGCYWHKCPICSKNIIENKRILNQPELDKARTKELQEQGYRVIRLWEHEIKVININKFKEMLIC